MREKKSRCVESGQPPIACAAMGFLKTPRTGATEKPFVRDFFVERCLLGVCFFQVDVLMKMKLIYPAIN